MTRGRWFLSILIALHLVALGVASLPDPDELNRVEPRSPAAHLFSPIITSGLDRIAEWVRAIEPPIVETVKPLQPLTKPYASLGLRQKWNMFSNPMTADQYVRLDYHVVTQGAPRSIRVFRELALPAQQENRVRLVHKFRDKAVLNALETFSVTRTHEGQTEQSLRGLEPLTKYFRNRLAREYLNSDERVLRTEVWYGQVPIPPPGQRSTAQQRESRISTLERYWYGASEVTTAPSAAKPGTLQREDPIIWRLEYVDER